MEVPKGRRQNGTVGSLDPDGSMRSLLEALFPEVTEPYRLAEHLINEGIKMLVTKVDGAADLYHTLFAEA